MVRILFGTTGQFKLEKGVQDCCHSVYLTCILSAEHIMRNARLDEIQAGIKIGGRNTNLIFADDTTLMAENKEELKSLLMRVKEESERASFKLNIKKTKIMASGAITSWEIEGEKVEVVTDFLFLGSKITGDGDCSHEIRWLLLGRKVITNLDKCVEKQRHYSADKVSYSQGFGLPSGHVHLWELDHKEGIMPKNWCLWTVVLDKTPKSPLDSKENKPADLKGNQPWTLVEKTDVEAEAPEFWSSDMNTWFIGKVPDAGENCRQKKRASEDEMAGWHHWCNGHKLGQTLGDDEGQGGLVCCSPWGRKESDTIGWLNNNRELDPTWHTVRPKNLKK